MPPRSRSPQGREERWLDPTRWAPHRYKTQMCRFHEQGACLRGKSCKFAHDESELHIVGKKLYGGDRSAYEHGKADPTSVPYTDVDVFHSEEDEQQWQAQQRQQQRQRQQEQWQERQQRQQQQQEQWQEQQRQQQRQRQRQR